MPLYTVKFVPTVSAMSAQTGDKLFGFLLEAAIPGSSSAIINITKKQLEKLRQQGLVESYEPTPTVHTMLADEADENRPGRADSFFAIAQAGQPIEAERALVLGPNWEDVQRQGNWGTGVAVYVVDTGYRPGGPAFEHKHARWIAPNGSQPHDDNGHGHWCAGTIGGEHPFGLAPDCDLTVVLALPGPGGSGTAADVANALKACADDAMARGLSVWIMSGSLGSDARDAVIDAAVSYGLARGGIMVFAAGNSGNGKYPLGSPVGAPGVQWRVGASEWNDGLCDFSSGGARDPVNCFILGREVPGANMAGGWMWPTGTSMATPQVAGLLTLGLASGLSHLAYADYARAHVRPQPWGAPAKGVSFMTDDLAPGTAPPANGYDWHASLMGNLDWIWDLTDQAQAAREAGDIDAAFNNCIGPIKDVVNLCRADANAGKAASGEGPGTPPPLEPPPVTQPPPTQPPPTKPIPTGRWLTGQYSSANTGYYNYFVPTDWDRKTVLFLWHGGGWAIGNPGIIPLADDYPVWAMEISNWFTMQGWALCQPAYRLGQGVQACLEDAGLAVRHFLHATVMPWGVGPLDVAYSGHSAGGHLAAAIALDTRWQAPAPKWVATLNGAGLGDMVKTQFKSPQTAQIFATAWGARSTWPQWGPWSHIAERPERPSFAILQGDADPELNAEWAAQFASKLRANDYYAIPDTYQRGSDHYACANPVRWPATADAILAVARR